MRYQKRVVGEEGGGGKGLLIDKGAYKEMDVCLMCHPLPGPAKVIQTGKSLATRVLTAEFFGHTSHAAAAPWEGKNALDAAYLAYTSLSMLRQQIKPTYRVHGVVEGRDWAANIIPDYAKLDYLVRAPTIVEVEVLCERVKACFEAAALASGCRLEYTPGIAMYDLRQNKLLAYEFRNIVTQRYGLKLYPENDDTSASTDFGNVTYELPALHPGFTIPTVANGGNHTALFAEAAGTQEAHERTMAVAKGLAVTAMRVLLDEDFYKQAKESFDTDIGGHLS